jgi:hypothetical protein
MLDWSERAKIAAWLHTYDNVNSLWDLGSGASDPHVDAAASLIGVSDELRSSSTR